LCNIPYCNFPKNIVYYNYQKDKGDIQMDTITITKDKAMYAFCASTCGCVKAIDCVYYGKCPVCCEARYFLQRLYENREKEG